MEAACNGSISRCKPDKVASLKNGLRILDERAKRYWITPGFSAILALNQRGLYSAIAVAGSLKGQIQVAVGVEQAAATSRMAFLRLIKQDAIVRGMNFGTVRIKW